VKTPNEVRVLSINDISGAMESCLINSEELLEEAHVLEKIGHQARAYFLCHTACEELAKFFILDIAGRRTAQNNPPNWRRFWQRLRSHESKLAQVEVRARVRPNAEPDSDEKLIEAGLDMLSIAGTAPRNMGLYVELDLSGDFRKPSAIDWSEPYKAITALVRHLIFAAKEIGTSSDEIRKALQSGPTDQGREHAKNTMVHILGQMRSSGMTEDDVFELLKKNFRS
jgi:AbiV family abortive infection protein